MDSTGLRTGQRPGFMAPEPRHEVTQVIAHDQPGLATNLWQDNLVQFRAYFPSFNARPL